MATLRAAADGIETGRASMKNLGDFVVATKKHAYTVNGETLTVAIGEDVQLVSLTSEGYAIRREDGRRLYGCGFTI